MVVGYLDMEESFKHRSGIVSVITAPLGFFALSLLIVEGFLTIVLVFSQMDTQQKFYGMLIGAGLFILVVVGVVILVWRKPTHLTFGERSHLEHERMLYGTEKDATSLIEVENADKKTDN